jgi:hypothetical protein
VIFTIKVIVDFLENLVLDVQKLNILRVLTMKQTFPSFEAAKSSLSNETSPSTVAWSVLLKKHLYAWNPYFAPWSLEIFRTVRLKALKIYIYMYLHGSNISRKFRVNTMHCSGGTSATGFFPVCHSQLLLVFETFYYFQVERMHQKLVGVQNKRRKAWWEYFYFYKLLYRQSFDLN